MTKDTFTQHVNSALHQSRQSEQNEEFCPSAMFAARLPRGWSDFEQRIIAVKRSECETYKRGSTDGFVAESQAYWANVLGYMADADESLAALGKQIISDLKISPPRETLKRILGLNEIDELTASAANAALFTVFNSSTYGVDMDDVALGIAAFIHCYVAGTEEEPTAEMAELPFGDDTVWTTLIIPHA